MTMAWEAQVAMLLGTSTPTQIEAALHAVLLEAGNQTTTPASPPYYQGRAGAAADIINTARHHLDPPLTGRPAA